VTLKRSEKSTWHLFQVCLHGTLYIYICSTSFKLNRGGQFFFCWKL
jgi:hypothetical protein